MPRWRDIDLTAIAEELPNLWCYDYDRAEDTFVVRLVGDRISDAFGRDLRGLTMRDVYPSADYPLFFARTMRVMSEPALARTQGLLARHGKEQLVGERIVLPLAEDGAQSPGVLGASDFILVEASEGPAADYWQWFPIA